MYKNKSCVDVCRFHAVQRSFEHLVNNIKTQSRKKYCKTCWQIIKKTQCFAFQMNFTKIYKILKYWPWSTMAIMASTRPFKKAYKTMLILLFLTMRPPDGLTWANDVSMRFNQKWATCQSKKSLFREWSPFWVVRKCI